MVALPGAAPLLQLRKELIRAQGAGGSGAARGPPGRQGGRGTPAGLPAGRGVTPRVGRAGPPGPGPRPPRPPRRPGLDNGGYCAPAPRRADGPQLQRPASAPARPTWRPSPPAAGGASAGRARGAGETEARTATDRARALCSGARRTPHAAGGGEQASNTTLCQAPAVQEFS